jgi:hypothetical protein
MNNWKTRRNPWYIAWKRYSLTKRKDSHLLNQFNKKQKKATTKQQSNNQFSIYIIQPVSVNMIQTPIFCKHFTFPGDEEISINSEIQNFLFLDWVKKSSFMTFAKFC